MLRRLSLSRLGLSACFAGCNRVLLQCNTEMIRYVVGTLPTRQKVSLVEIHATSF